MKYPKSTRYDTPYFRSKMMGPNPVKVGEELLIDHQIPEGATVMDLGSGQGLTSLFLEQAYGFQVYAVDLWSDPAENQIFFDQMGVPRDRIIPIKSDAVGLPFEKDFFDAVISIDSYNYFGRDPDYLDRSLLPCVKPGGLLYIAIPGMKKDCHSNLPAELLLSWTPDQLAYMHDVEYWRKMIEQSSAKILSISEMVSNEEVWNDWLACNNEYAIGDRRAMEAGGGRYLSFIRIVLQKAE
ncbi:MAG: methyltransferase domain-containing protein [Planctomycetia bacterium]|nr:methyltransferase domain-containing protein [Planctomycetia bacterium]